MQNMVAAFSCGSRRLSVDISDSFVYLALKLDNDEKFINSSGGSCTFNDGKL